MIRRVHCPTGADLMPVYAGLLPRGLAWGAIFREGSWMWRFFRGIADATAVLEQRLCAARAELFCRSATETRDWWLIDHGLPDACDPYPDPCVKRQSSGATRCEQWAEIAALAGWSISCRMVAACGARAGSARTGGARTGHPWPGPVIVVTVDVAASSAWVAPRHRPARAGSYRTGQAVGCGPDISALQCLLERLIPDHLGREWEIINNG